MPIVFAGILTPEKEPLLMYTARSLRRAIGFFVFGSLSTTFGCSDPDPSTLDDVEPQEGEACTRDEHCDDGVFCNGRERCRPERDDANDLGCVRGSAPRCDDGLDCSRDSCDRELDRCVFVAKDEDGDGFGDASCEDADGNPLGDDCDDDDSNAYPGNYETCDEDGVDEDCDPTTFGYRDEDGDGSISDECCNGDNCGDDCDDTNLARSPKQPEFCDKVDNDCDGEVDNDTQDVPWYVDRDGDGFGVNDGEVKYSCVPIKDRVLLGTDCADGNNELNPAQNETCDEIDNDCDSVADEGGHCPGDPNGTPVAGPGLSTSDAFASEVSIRSLCCTVADACKWGNDGICDCPDQAWDQADCSSGETAGDGTGGGASAGTGGGTSADAGGASVGAGGASTGAGGVSAGGSGEGGSSNGGMGGSGSDGGPDVGLLVFPILIEDGWASGDTTAVGIEGPLYAAADPYSSDTLSSSFEGAEACMAGEAAPVNLTCTLTNPEATDCYGEHWGAALGFYLNRAAEDDAEPGTIDASDFYGIGFGVGGSDVPDSLRFVVQTMDGSWYCAEIAAGSEMSYFVAFTDLTRECWTGGAGERFDERDATAFEWQVVTNSAESVPFDFCLSNVEISSY